MCLPFCGYEDFNSTLGFFIAFKLCRTDLEMLGIFFFPFDECKNLCLKTLGLFIAFMSPVQGYKNVSIFMQISCLYIYCKKHLILLGFCCIFLAFVLPVKAANNVFLTSYWLLKAIGICRCCIYFDIILLLFLRALNYGDLATECAFTYYKYGCALLYKAQSEADPLCEVRESNEDNPPSNTAEEAGLVFCFPV